MPNEGNLGKESLVCSNFSVCAAEMNIGRVCLDHSLRVEAVTVKKPYSGSVKLLATLYPQLGNRKLSADA